MLPDHLQADVDAIRRIDAVPSILEVVCRTTGMRFAAVARVTDDHWIACSVNDGINFGVQSGDELQLKTTLCDEIRRTGEVIVIDHVDESETYCRHHTPAKYGFQSYISVPIRRTSGEFFGTLCAIDPQPARLDTPETIGMFKLFADLIGFHLDAEQRLESTQAHLLRQSKDAELREQFIAVLGHDLRNPLASIASGANMLRRMQLNESANGIIDLVLSSVHRMTGLIDNVLDFARGRLGGGLSLTRNANDPLLPMLEQVINELRATHPHRHIEFTEQMVEPVSCDRTRIGQLLSNLAANALAHGRADAPVQVEALARDGIFQLSVANQGEPIPAHLLDKLFEPFFRASAQPSKQGLGLGLYIANEIARSHGGSLSAISTLQETRFTLRMPTR